MSVFFAILKRDLILAHRAAPLRAPAVFLLAAAALPLAAGPYAKILSEAATGLLWTFLLLILLLSLERLFDRDLLEGTDALFLTAPFPAAAWPAAKALALMIHAVLPLALAAPLAGVFFLAMPPDRFWPLCFSILIAAPALSFLGTLCAVLSGGLARAQSLLALILLPLYLPLLLLGSAAAHLPLSHFFLAPPVLVLALCSLMALALVPAAAALILRNQA